ncbi:MAG: hypothetical protein LBB79_08705 [Prevotellaceae bacterium]|jgi:hypothetical protein|nr:hypothetical protein [Prevotellaceae bacterium]
MLPVVALNTQACDACALLPYDELLLLKTNVAMEAYDSSLPKSPANLWKDKNEDKIYTCNFIEQQEIIDRWVDLNLKFKKSFAEKNHLFPNVSPEVIYNDFRKSLAHIFSLSPKNISVGISDDECAYIYFEKEGRSAYFDLFFEPEQPTEAAIAVFENKASTLSFTDYLDNSIIKIRNEFTAENELPLPAFAAI